MLSGIERIPVCVGYRVGGTVHDEMPVSQSDFHHAEPVYEELPGWNVDITKVTDYDDLPDEAKGYVDRLEELCGVPIRWVSVGPSRDQTLQRVSKL